MTHGLLIYAFTRLFCLPYRFFLFIEKPNESSVFFFFSFQYVCTYWQVCATRVYTLESVEKHQHPHASFFSKSPSTGFFFTLFFKYFYGKYVVCEGDQHLCVFCVWYVKKVIRGFIRAFRFTPTHPSAPRVAIDRGRARGPSARA